MDEERPEGPRSNFMVGQEPKVQVQKPILPMPTGVPTLPGGKAPSTLSAPVGVSPQQAEILSEELKKEGNQLYNDGQLEAAEMVYSEAIKVRKLLWSLISKDHLFVFTLKGSCDLHSPAIGTFIYCMNSRMIAY